MTGNPELSPFDPDGARLASAAQRLGGFLLDAVILLVVSLPFVYWILGGELVLGDEVPSELPITLQIISGVYYVVLTAVRGQTIGKMVLGTKVVGFDRGGLPTWGQSFIRWALPAAVGAIPGVGLLVLLMYAWLLWDRRNQGLHDKAARTLVIDTRYRVAA